MVVELMHISKKFVSRGHQTKRGIRNSVGRDQKGGSPKKGDPKLCVSWKKGGSPKKGGSQTVSIVTKRGIPKNGGVQNGDDPVLGLRPGLPDMAAT